MGSLKSKTSCLVNCSKIALTRYFEPTSKLFIWRDWASRLQMMMLLITWLHIFYHSTSILECDKRNWLLMGKRWLQDRCGPVWISLSLLLPALSNLPHFVWNFVNFSQSLLQNSQFRRKTLRHELFVSRACLFCRLSFLSFICRFIWVQFWPQLIRWNCFKLTFLLLPRVDRWHNHLGQSLWLRYGLLWLFQRRCRNYLYQREVHIFHFWGYFLKILVCFFLTWFCFLSIEIGFFYRPLLIFFF